MGDNGDPDNFLSIHLGGWAAKPGAATNIAFYENPDMDRLLVQARTVSDLVQRQHLYEQALALWRRDLPLLPLVHGETIVVLRSDVTGFTLSKTGDLFLGPVKPAP